MKGVDGTRISPLEEIETILQRASLCHRSGLNTGELIAGAKEYFAARGKCLDDAITKTTSPVRRAVVFAIAASVAAAAVGVAFYVAESRPPPAAVEQHHQTAETSQRFALEDKSSVLLYEHSRLDVKMSEHVRRVDLAQGSAAFDVAHEDRPFELHAGTVVATATGTHFKVFRRPDRIDIYLPDGGLRVEVPNVKTLQMTSGDIARIQDNGVIETTRADAHSTAPSRDHSGRVKRYIEYWNSKVAALKRP